MYNRYIPAGTRYEQVSESSPGSNRSAPKQSVRKTQIPPKPPLTKAAPLEGITGRLGGVLGKLHLENLDNGDILLLLILLFIFMESDDNLELVITLGLLLLFGLFGSEEECED